MPGGGASAACAVRHACRAHGFVALEDNTQFLYKTTNYYHKESEGAILWNDSTLAIDWPLEGIEEVLVSDKDKEADYFKNI